MDDNDDADADDDGQCLTHYRQNNVICRFIDIKK